MPTKLVAVDPIITIVGDTLSIHPDLKPEPDGGLQISFTLEYSKDPEQPLHFVAETYIHLADVTERGYPEQEELTPQNDVRIYTPDLGKLRGNPKADIVLRDLAQQVLDRDTRKPTIEDFFRDLLMRSFFFNYTISAKIDRIGDPAVTGVKVSIICSREGSAAYTFNYLCSPEVAGKLFESEVLSSAAAAS
jgi:hypothetical protein